MWNFTALFVISLYGTHMKTYMDKATYNREPKMLEITGILEIYKRKLEH